jgi:hypothetical protein
MTFFYQKYFGSFYFHILSPKQAIKEATYFQIVLRYAI